MEDDDHAGGWVEDPLFLHEAEEVRTERVHAEDPLFLDGSEAGGAHGQVGWEEMGRRWFFFLLD